ncbi:hypothetical protein [Limnochorda pilosa]|uniref:Global transcriptional regulator CodY n=1 Tax=Limnochorda pilosa TaxID=1555112 RepID=A0A0K2SQ24_LIMPI|nr:hypothetical protein [Limnochorda pilosa]BAS28934.1 GTP-sensing transcriptional pleiotropic repressor CodY [Limnochorda pilosa]
MLKEMQKISQVLQASGNNVSLTDLAAALRDSYRAETSVYVISPSGKVLGHALMGELPETAFDAEWIEARRVPEDLGTSLLKVGALSTGAEVAHVIGADLPAVVLPIIGSGRRVGTLLLVRLQGAFSDQELALADYAATAAGMVIGRALDEEEEDLAEEKRMARSAIRSLSYSEILAMQHIFDELQGDEGLLVASRIADEAGITRSVIVNALRKLASANVIESRSLGMKGTYLRILNREIRNELERQRYPYLSGSALMKKQA